MLGYQHDHNQTCISHKLSVHLVAQSSVEHVVVHACDHAVVVIAAFVVTDVEQECGTSHSQDVQSCDDQALFGGHSLEPLIISLTYLSGCISL